ncbi:hypothetical protein CVT23_04225, partial [Minwuia thermotolerans]
MLFVLLLQDGDMIGQPGLHRRRASGAALQAPGVARGAAGEFVDAQFAAVELFAERRREVGTVLPHPVREFAERRAVAGINAARLGEVEQFDDLPAAEIRGDLLQGAMEFLVRRSRNVRLAALCRARRVAAFRRFGPGGVFVFAGRFGRVRVVVKAVVACACVERVIACFAIEAVERVRAPGLGHVGEAVGAEGLQHLSLGLRLGVRVGGNQQRPGRARGSFGRRRGRILQVETEGAVEGRLQQFVQLRLGRPEWVHPPVRLQPEAALEGPDAELEVMIVGLRHQAVGPARLLRGIVAQQPQRRLGRLHVRLAVGAALA